jgi:hypothetical protein
MQLVLSSGVLLSATVEDAVRPPGAGWRRGRDLGEIRAGDRAMDEGRAQASGAMHNVAVAQGMTPAGMGAKQTAGCLSEFWCGT